MMNTLFTELKRRNVLRVTVLYVVLSWIILQVAEVLLGLLEVPAWSGKLVFVLLLLGLPLVVVFAWAYEITPEGLKRESEVDRSKSITPQTGRKMNILIGVLAGVAILLIVAQGFVPGLSRRTAAADAHAGKVTSASIAVLPFVNMSSDKEQEYFSDGLSEELLNLLAKIPELTVISRTSSFQFKGKTQDVRAIAQQLGVAHVLEGSVRKSANKVRITAQLIDANDGSHLWSETYDRDLNDIFAVQDEIAGEVVKALQVTILGEAPRTRAATQNTDAYNLLLQGRYFAERRTAADGAKAIEYLEQTVTLEPGYAPAWAELSRVYRYQAMLSNLPMEEGIAKARHAAERALGSDANLSAGHIALAMIEMTFDWNWTAAEGHILRGEALDPASYDVLFARAHLALALGRLNEGIAIMRQVAARDPLRATIHNSLGIALLRADSLAMAESAFRKAVELSPSMQAIYNHIAQTLLLQGKAEQALAAALQEGDEFWRALSLALVHHALGHTNESDAALQELENRFADDGAYQIAQVHAYRGEADLAFRWLDRAFRQRDPGLTGLKGDPFISKLANDPRHRALLRKMKLPE